MEKNSTSKRFYNTLKDKTGRACKAAKLTGLAAITAAGLGGGVAEGGVIHVDEFSDFLTKDTNAVSYTTGNMYDNGAVPTDCIMAIAIKERDIEGTIVPTHVGGVKNDPADIFSSANEASGWINPYTQQVWGLLDGEKVDYWNGIKSSDKWFGWYDDSTGVFTIENEDTYYPKISELNFEAFSQSGQPKDAGTINVPEPATLSFLGIGLSSLLFRRRLRKYRKDNSK